MSAGYPVIAAAAILLIAAAAPIPPIGGAKNGGVYEAAVYATVNGEVMRLTTVTVTDEPSPQYPARARRLNIEGDVFLRCPAPRNCVVSRAPRWPDLSMPAVDAATALATPGRDYPFDAVISFRILTNGPEIAEWAPSACPDPKHPSPADAGERRALELTGKCYSRGN